MSTSNDTTQIHTKNGHTGIVDKIDEDLSAINKVHWIAHMSSSGTFYLHCNTYIGGKRKTICLHRLIMARVLGRDLGTHEHIDHADGNGLNNKRSNLRLCTPAQNQHNSKLRKDNTTGFKGVHYRKDVSKWGSEITVNGKRIYLGAYNTAEEAHAAYCEAAKKHFGEFARF